MIPTTTSAREPTMWPTAPIAKPATITPANSPR
jgi:hypothetical protein